MIEAILVPVEGNPSQVELPDEENYEKIKSHLEDAWLEYVDMKGRPGFMYVDEEGLMKKLPYNPVATMLAGKPIVGTAIVLGYANEDGEETSVHPDVKKEILGG